jgi:nicotinamidase-related amidase
MLTDRNNAALVLIDVQNGFDDLSHWGSRNNPNAETVMFELLQLWRRSGWPVVHIRHMSTESNSPLRPGQAGNEFKSQVQPINAETVIEKAVNSGFIGTNLEKHLRALGVDTVVLVGISTDHCVSTTARMSGNLGFTTLVVADGTFTFNRTTYDGIELKADEIHRSALASLHNEFATVVESSQIIEALSAKPVH